MAHYRVYFLNSINQIVQHADLEAPNDAAAWQSARAVFADIAALELWSGQRLVGVEPLAPERRSHFCDDPDAAMLYARYVMPEPTRRLWSAVLLQAYADLEEEAFGSYWWNQASAFFFGGGDWIESRRNVCDCLGIDPAAMIRPALRVLNKRRLEHGLPPVSPRPTTPRVPAPAARRAAVPVPPPRAPLPLLVAIPAPPPPPRPAPTPKNNGWRARYGRNPFDPFQALPSERRAAGS